MTVLKNYTRREERANALTHWIGVGLFPIAIYLFYSNPIAFENRWIGFSLAIMFVGMITSYLSSALYHSCGQSELKGRLRKLDHAAIYLNIAGGYTPFLLNTLREEGYWGWSLLAVVWGGALLGIALNFRKMKKTNLIKTLSYLLLGWVVVIALVPLYNVFQPENRLDVFYWLGIEALLYTLGTFIYAFAKREFAHTIWHLFVLGGTAAQLVAVYRALF